MRSTKVHFSGPILIEKLY